MKQLFTLKQLFLISVLIMAFGFAKAQLPETPPLAWWTMAPSPDGNDTVVFDNMGKYHGFMKEYEATDTTFVDGKVGKALQFDGDTNHVVVNDTVPFMKDEGFSICFWMKMDFNDGVVWSFPVTTGNYQEPNTVYLALNRENATATNHWMRIYSWDKDLNSRLVHRKANGDWTDLMENKWRYIAAVNTADKMTLYIDGIDAARNSDASNGYEFSRPFRFGKRDGNVNHFKGLIDEIRVYDYPLTPEQITALMGIETQAQMQTQEFKLNHYPNPFKDATTISFELGKAGKVSLEILNINGQVVKTLVALESRQAGSYKELWDCRSDNGTVQPAGIYLYRLKVDSETVGIGKMMLAK